MMASDFEDDAGELIPPEVDESGKVSRVLDKIFSR